MREIPILFSTPMVQAILDGRKSMTRRVIKAPVLYKVSKEPNRITRFQDMWKFWWNGPATCGSFDVKCPYGQPSDRLWVRETWAWGKRYSEDYAMTLETIPKVKPDYAEIWYKADENHEDWAEKWKPSIHMPKWAARIWLEVTDVRVERLQEISEEDADAEGFGGDFPPKSFPEHMGSKGWYEGDKTIVECFAELWDSLNAKRGYGWDTNPWLWVVSFRRVQP